MLVLWEKRFYNGEKEKRTIDAVKKGDIKEEVTKRGKHFGRKEESFENWLDRSEVGKELVSQWGGKGKWRKYDYDFMECGTASHTAEYFMAATTIII